MTDNLNLKDKFKSLIAKLKKIKHIEIYIAVGLAVLVAIIYFASISSSSSDKNSSSSKDDNLSTNFSTSQEYVVYLENKLENVLEDIKGVGNANVIITLEKGFEYIYVTEEETKTTSNGTTITTVTVVLVDGQPVLKEEIYPIIKGIVVVTDGADDINTKMNIITVIQTVIDIDNSKINIVSGD